MALDLKYILYNRLILISCFLILSIIATAQDIQYPSFGKGLQVKATDSTFTMKMSVRFQTLYSGTFNTSSDEWSDQLLIRRARLKFDGYALTPKLVYKIELGLSNRDIGAGNIPQTGFTNRIILDAAVKWNFYGNWVLWAGQTKLPGNRERVISSQKLQFVDRSLVNSRFNIDRDIGLQLRHKDRLGERGVLREILSISMGEGRNIVVDNQGGYDYTFRLEYLPFGEFTNDGDYFSSDLEREAAPKLSVGVTFDYNDDAARQRGQLGAFTLDSLSNQVTNDLTTVFVDAIFKYKGWSIQSEYAYKESDRRIIVGPLGSLNFGTGEGWVIQGGYLFANNLELAARITSIKPNSNVFSGLIEENEYTIGLSKYFKGHNLKLQTDLSFRDRADVSDFIQFRTQFELAF